MKSAPIASSLSVPARWLARAWLLALVLGCSNVENINGGAIHASCDAGDGERVELFERGSVEGACSDDGSEPAAGDEEEESETFPETPDETWSASPFGLWAFSSVERMTLTSCGKPRAAFTSRLPRPGKRA